MPKRKSGSALPRATFSAEPVLSRSRIGMPHGVTPRLWDGLEIDDSHNLFVIPIPGLLPAPTQTRNPSSFRWNELLGPPQSAENGAGSSEQLVMKRCP